MTLWLAAGGYGWVLEKVEINERARYKSDSRTLLVCSGADEQCGCYIRHKTKFKQGSLLLPKIQMTTKGNGQNDIYIVKSTMPKSHTATDQVEQPFTMNPEIKNAEQFSTGGPTKGPIFTLFLKQLTLLSPLKLGVRGLKEEFLSNNSMDINNGQHQRRIHAFWRSVWRFVSGLDITLKLPVLIIAGSCGNGIKPRSFLPRISAPPKPISEEWVPFSIWVRIIHGAVVTSELTPLWVLGPVAIALYVKMFQWICGLYIFSFKSMATVVKSTPRHLLLCVSYVSDGGLRSDLERQISYIHGVDLRQIWRRSAEGVMDGFVGVWFDFVELIWPLYCRSLRFLKRASFI